MALRKSTRYGLYAAVEMARASGERSVTVAQVAGRYGVSVSVLAKAFQRLARAGIARGTRGVLGGYGLTGRPEETTVLDVIEAFEPRRHAGRCLLADDDGTACARPSACRLRKLVDEVDEVARRTYASVTLETLVDAAVVAVEVSTARPGGPPEP